MADLEARCFIKRGNALVPADFAADEYLAALPEGREITVRMHCPRSPQHHRWFFGLLRKVVGASDQWANEDDLLDDLKDAVGHVEPAAINPLTQQVRRRTRSINFASMSEDKFKRFKDRCIYVLCLKLGYDPVVLMEEADAMQRLPWRKRHGHQVDASRRCA